MRTSAAGCAPKSASRTPAAVATTWSASRSYSARPRINSRISGTSCSCARSMRMCIRLTAAGPAAMRLRDEAGAQVHVLIPPRVGRLDGRLLEVLVPAVDQDDLRAQRQRALPLFPVHPPVVARVHHRPRSAEG